MQSITGTPKFSKTSRLLAKKGVIENRLAILSILFLKDCYIFAEEILTNCIISWWTREEGCFPHPSPLGWVTLRDPLAPNSHWWAGVGAQR